ncbi:c-type cytochrome [Nitrosomonas communis]|uniref:Cytochrome c551 n=1 Tax=Nitrosomonas communis TaxID=44574 RepID=A0A1I4SPQ1_9PROT|nr:cytochrome c [Nitrosomonas communis]SFM66361.1 cytochrome c551 [Nitrosomonas communis]
MKKITLLFATIGLTSLVSCAKTDNYTPPATASGEEIFSLNCTKCHKPNTDGSVLVLDPAMANKDAIIKKVQTGSMGMTAFPNIQGEPADRLAEYVLVNSRTK